MRRQAAASKSLRDPRLRITRWYRGRLRTTRITRPAERRNSRPRRIKRRRSSMQLRMATRVHTATRFRMAAQLQRPGPMDRIHAHPLVIATMLRRRTRLRRRTLRAGQASAPTVEAAGARTLRARTTAPTGATDRVQRIWRVTTVLRVRIQRRTTLPRTIRAGREAAIAHQVVAATTAAAVGTPAEALDIDNTSRGTDCSMGGPQGPPLFSVPCDRFVCDG